MSGSRLSTKNAITAKAVVAFLFVACVARAADDASLELGPFRMGMTHDEIRAATPQLTWSESNSPMESRHQKLLSATAAMELGGRPYDARVTRGWYGAYQLVLSRKAEERNDNECLKVYTGMLADLEHRFGAFEATNQEYKRSSLEVAIGGAGQTETRKTGTSSFTWHTNKAYSEASATRTQGTTALSTVGQYFVSNPLFGESTCVTAVTLETKGSPPEFEEIDVRDLKPLMLPSIGTLHESLEGVPLTTGATRIQARCRISRTAGTVGVCELDDKLPRGIRNAISVRSGETIFDTSNLDPGNPSMLFTYLEFRLDPAQRLKLDTPTKPLDPENIEWSNARDAVRTERNLIISAARAEQYDTATATTDCQIQTDGSLACLPLSVVLAEGTAENPVLKMRFQDLARSRLRGQRAPATSKDGASTRGRWVRFQSELKLRQYSNTRN